MEPKRLITVRSEVQLPPGPLENTDRSQNMAVKERTPENVRFLSAARRQLNAITFHDRNR